MILDYATLISPYPFYIPNVGHIKSPTLREIWHPDITYQKYLYYISLLLLTPLSYCENINKEKLDWYNDLSDSNKSKLSMIYFIKNDKQLQNTYSSMFNFFLQENVIWNDSRCVFFTYIEADNTGNIIPTGVIQSDIFEELCDAVLQRCGVNRNDIDTIDETKVKNKRALEILKKIKIHEKKTPKKDKDIELPNLISKVSVMAKSINYTNIWDLTVFQLYEQFKQECSNVYFNISTMSVAAWGNENKSFKGNEWYRNEN